MRLIIALFLLCPTLAFAQQVRPGLMTPSAWTDYQRAAELFNAGKRVQAGCVMYRGQFRARLLLLVEGNSPSDGAPALFASLSETVGRPINEWLGGDRDEWIAAMECARDWAANNSDPDYPRRRYGKQHAQMLAGLNELIAAIPPAAELRKQRRAAGLPNR